MVTYSLVYSLSPIRTLLASFLFCDRPIAGDVRGSGDTAPSSAFRVGSVVAERLYLVCGCSYLVHRCIPIKPLGVPNTLLLSHSSQVPYFRPLFGPEFPCFVPKRRRQQSVVGLRVRVTLALFHHKPAFYRPNKASD